DAAEQPAAGLRARAGVLGRGGRRRGRAERPGGRRGGEGQRRGRGGPVQVGGRQREREDRRVGREQAVPVGVGGGHVPAQPALRDRPAAQAGRRDGGGDGQGPAGRG